MAAVIVLALVTLFSLAGGDGWLTRSAGEQSGVPSSSASLVEREKPGVEPALDRSTPRVEPAGRATLRPDGTDAPASSPAAQSSPPRVEPTPPAAAQPTPPIGQQAAAAFVPVVDFWSGETSIGSDELRRALTGRSSRFRRVIVPTDDRSSISAVLGIRLSPAVEDGDPATIREAVGSGALGVLRAEDVTPAVRALAVDGRSLYGNERLEQLSDWPLRAVVAMPPAERWQQAATWTLVAGGDIQLDRRMAYQVTTLGRGVDWPWDGGRVRITDRFCCSYLGHRLPTWERTGGDGALRALFSEADLALANLEAAAVDDPAYHALGPRFKNSLNFSGDPRLLEGLRNTGFDFLSLANNHIHNAGAQGIRDTRRALRRLGIAFAGAGSNLERALRPALLEAGGQSVAVLGCTSVGHVVAVDRPGAASCATDALVRQIRRAAQSADVVIVFPHWGREYRAEPGSRQRLLAHRWVEAGADLVLGAHSHWAGAIEEVDGRLVLYSLGNLAFDQPWSEPTMQGVIVELTFHGQRLVQLRLHPTLIVDDVQPNLLEYDGGGERVIRRMRDASEGLLPY